MYKYIENNFWKIALLQTLLLLIITGLVGVGTLPAEAGWVSFGIVSALILISPIFYGALFTIIGIPFYIILPNPWLVELTMWRPLFAVLFLCWFAHFIWQVIQKSKTRQPQKATNSFKSWKVYLKQFDDWINPWDKFIALFLFIALISLVFARFQVYGFKQLLFIVNILLLYWVVSRATVSTQQFLLLRKTVLGSLLVITALGFLQYLLTFFSEPYYFWQYWALMISKAYYGVPLAEVLIYSNSWFTSGTGVKALRMFGVLQDTHAFGILAVFALGLSTSYLKVQSSLTANTVWVRFKNFVVAQRKIVWLAILLSSLAVVLSGTRGIWIGMLPVSILCLMFLYFKLQQRNIKLLLIAQGLVVFWLVVSPLLTLTFNWVRSFDVDDSLLKRASSIYDLSESSNVGRLQIWQESISFAVQNPLGTGYGNFITSVVDNIPPSVSFESVADDVNKTYNLPQKYITAHNLYLHLLVELGVIGLAGFAAIVITVLGVIWRLIKYGQDSGTVLIALSLAFSMLWLLSYGFFDLTILNDRVLMFTVLLLTLLGFLQKPLSKQNENLD